MRQYARVIICGILILLSIIANVYSVLWVLWKVPVSVRIDPLDPRSSDLSVSCNPSTISVGSITLIDGRLCNATSRTGILGQEISLYYSQSGNNSWMHITSVNTISNGTYSYTWTDAATLDSGSYVIRATFAGNLEFDGWSSLTDLQVFPGLPPGDLSLDNIEPIQVVSNSKALIANKSTAMRVDIFSIFSGNTKVMINVTYDFGTKIYTEQGGEGDGVTIEPGWNRVYIPGGPIYNKQGEEWAMQEQVWSPPEGDDFFLKWSGTGSDNNVTVVLDPDDVIAEMDETNNEMKISENIVESKPLKILVVPVYFPNIGQSPETPSMDNQKDFLLGTYPVADDKLEWQMSSPMPFYKRPPSADSFPAPLRFMQWLYKNVGVPITDMAKNLGYDRAVIVIHGLGQGKYWSGWAPGMLFRFPQNRVPVFVDEAFFSLWDGSLVAHEIGHTYYLWHPHDIGPPIYDAWRYWVLNKSYGEYSRTFMSYSGELPSGVPYSPVWIDNGRFDSDPPAYRGLFGFLTWNLFDQITISHVNEMTQSGDSEVIAVSFDLHKNNTVQIDDPWYRLSKGTPDLNVGSIGNYSVVTLDDLGEIISRMGFNASFTIVQEINQTYSLAETDRLTFAFNIPYFDGGTLIEIRNTSDNVLASRAITNNSPTLNISSPNGEEILTAGINYTISWNGSDLDDDKLAYALAYSEDGGENWVPLAIDLNQTTYVWNTCFLKRGSNYLVKAIASDGVNTGEDVSDSTFTVKVHDVATTNIITSKTIVGQGTTPRLDVTVANKGDFTETFSVTAYGNTTSMETKEVTLTAGANTTVTFEWNTTGVACGNYTISASAIPVELEFYTQDNIYVDGTVLVTITGDVNGDFSVESSDLFDLSKVYGCTPEEPNWTPNCDLNSDDKVDASDLFHLGKNYGETI